jgi:hypothetical protein
MLLLDDLSEELFVTSHRFEGSGPLAAVDLSAIQTACLYESCSRSAGSRQENH